MLPLVEGQDFVADFSRIGTSGCRFCAGDGSRICLAYFLECMGHHKVRTGADVRGPGCLDISADGESVRIQLCVELQFCFPECVSIFGPQIAAEWG